MVSLTPEMTEHAWEHLKDIGLDFTVEQVTGALLNSASAFAAKSMPGITVPVY